MILYFRTHSACSSFSFPGAPLFSILTATPDGTRLVYFSPDTLAQPSRFSENQSFACFTSTVVQTD
jgi:hypothetical protein